MSHDQSPTLHLSLSLLTVTHSGGYHARTGAASGLTAEQAEPTIDFSRLVQLYAELNALEEIIGQPRT